MELRLIDKELYAVVWKTPASGARPMAIAAQLPEHCEPRTSGQSIWDGTAYLARWTATCPGGLEGGVIQIEGLDQTSTDVLVRFDFADGLSEARRLTAAHRGGGDGGTKEVQVAQGDRPSLSRFSQPIFGRYPAVLKFQFG